MYIDSYILGISDHFVVTSQLHMHYYKHFSYVKTNVMILQVCTNPKLVNNKGCNQVPERRIYFTK